jgi:hypothetical protein
MNRRLLTMRGVGAAIAAMIPAADTQSKAAPSPSDLAQDSPAHTRCLGLVPV